MRATPEEFVRAWLDSTSVKQVADKLGMTISGVMARAKLYRSKGVALPDFRRIVMPIDADALNALVRDVAR